MSASSGHSSGSHTHKKQMPMESRTHPPGQSSAEHVGAADELSLWEPRIVSPLPGPLKLPESPMASLVDFNRLVSKDMVSK